MMEYEFASSVLAGRLWLGNLTVACSSRNQQPILSSGEKCFEKFLTVKHLLQQEMLPFLYDLHAKKAQCGPFLFRKAGIAVGLCNYKTFSNQRELFTWVIQNELIHGHSRYFFHACLSLPM